MLIVGSVVTCAALLLLLLLRLARRRRQPAPLPEPIPAAPGAPVAARAPGAATPVAAIPVAARAPGAAAPPPPRRRHDNSGLAHFTRPASNTTKRASR